MRRIDPPQTIEWEESMATGIAVIDKQHRYLFDTLKTAGEEPLTGDDSMYLQRLAKQLLGYAIVHFETEESLMQNHGYQAACPEEAEIHIRQHREFSQQIVTYCDRIREGEKVSRSEFLKFLNHWLRDHVLNTDQKLGTYLVRNTDHDSLS